MQDLTPRLIQPIGHTRPLSSVDISPDNKLIITGGVDETVKIWTREGKEIYTIEDHEGMVSTVAFSPKNDQFLTASHDSRILLWNLKSLELEQTLLNKGNQVDIDCACYSPDGKMILSGGKEGKVTLWKLQEKVKGKTKSISFNFTKKNIKAVAFSPNSKKIAFAFESEVIIITLSSEGRKTFDVKETIYDLCFSEDNSQVITCTDKGNVYFHKTSTGKKISSFQAHKKAVHSISCSSKGHLVTGSTDKSIKIWKERRNKYTSTEMKTKHDGTVVSVKFSADGEYVLSGSIDKTAILHDLSNNGKYSQLKGYAQSIFDAAFSNNDLEILVGSSQPFGFLWDLKIGDLLSTRLPHKETYTDEDRPTRSVGYTKNESGGFLFTGSSNNKIRFWNPLDKQKKDVEIELNTGIRSMAMSSDNSFLVAGTKSDPRNTFICYLNDPDNPIEMKGHTKRVTAVAISPDDSLIATGSHDTSVKIWDAKTRKIKKTKNLHDGFVHSVAFSPDGLHFASASADKTIILYDAKSFRKKKEFKADDEVYDIVFSPNSEYLLSGSLDSNAILWNLNGKRKHEFKTHKLTVSTVAFSNSGKYAITGSHDCMLKLWDVSTGEELISLTQIAEKDWVVSTPKGLFDASSGAMKLMHYVVGSEVIELDQLKERYWQPGLLSSVLHLTKADLKDVSEFKDVPLYPEIVSMEIRRKKLYVEIKERTGGIGRVSLQINNKERESDINPDGLTTFSVSLSDYDNFFANGDNKVSIRCWNRDGWLPSQFESRIYSVRKKAQKEDSKVSFHTLMIGTSKYRNERMTLAYPDQDAGYLHDAMNVVGSLLFKENINQKLLTTEHPGTESFSNKENIEKAFEEVAQKVKPQDIVLIYFSGHGANFDDGRKAQYYYLTHEIMSSNLSDSAIRESATISSDDLTKWINQIPAQKQVLIFDTCYSGKVTETLSSKNAVESTRDRALERMKDRTGMFVLTGSAGDKVSYEASNYGQGLLTYSLLQGMRGASLSKDNNQQEYSIDVMRLFTHAREEVERLSKEFSVLQRPTLRAPHNIESFDIGIAPISARQQIQIALPKPVFERSVFMNSKNFLDDQNISVVLDQYLQGSIGIGNRPEAIFIDTSNFPGSHAIKGLYTLNSSGLKVKGSVFKDEKVLGSFVVEGEKMEDIVPKIARRVEQIAYQVEEEEEIGYDEETALIEKGKLENYLKEIKGKPEFGFKDDFIDGHKITMPVLNSALKKDVAVSNEKEKILHYQYYSVVQSKSRKFPFFAACNFNGGEFRQLGRVGKFEDDPRLDQELQWGDEFYKFGIGKVGGKNKRFTNIFDRGHMTKREDTQWGKDDTTAKRGAILTFFFTNALPQHGHLNRQVWRGLEDYILKSASANKKLTKGKVFNINIITGPVFQKDDPAVEIKVGKDKKTTQDVQLPVLFWKVVYFKKQSDNKLYYLGFLMGQKTLVEEAFGDFKVKAKGDEAAKDEPFLNYKDKEVFQVKISFIEKLTGLKFSKATDPMKNSKGGNQISEVLKTKKKDAADDIEDDGLTYKLEGLDF